MTAAVAAMAMAVAAAVAVAVAADSCTQPLRERRGAKLPLASDGVTQLQDIGQCCFGSAEGRPLGKRRSDFPCRKSKTPND